MQSNFSYSKHSQQPLCPQHQHRAFMPQLAYPMMANVQPTTRTHGVFSTYGSRLKSSDDNALLLPESYITKRRARFTGTYALDDDNEFEDLMEESSAEDDTDNQSRMSETGGAAEDGSNGKTRGVMMTLKSDYVATPPLPASTAIALATGELRKTIRKKNEIFYSSKDHGIISNVEEVLVPIRLDIDIESVKLRDRFLWNMNEQFLTPERFAEMLCDDLDLPPYKFLQPIADSIRAQVLDFETTRLVKLPPEHSRVLINLDLQIGKINYRDQFEWDLQSSDQTDSISAEVFSKQLAAELGIGGEYVALIAHAIREQAYRCKRQYLEEHYIQGEIRGDLATAYRTNDEAKDFVPKMEILSNDELEKLLISQERDIRRMRRETRFKRSRR